MKKCNFANEMGVPSVAPVIGPLLKSTSRSLTPKTQFPSDLGSKMTASGVRCKDLSQRGQQGPRVNCPVPGRAQIRPAPMPTHSGQGRGSLGHPSREVPPAGGNLR